MYCIVMAASLMVCLMVLVPVWKYYVHIYMLVTALEEMRDLVMVLSSLYLDCKDISYKLGS